MKPEHNISIRNHWTSGSKKETGCYPVDDTAESCSIHFSSVYEYMDYCKNSIAYKDNHQDTGNGSDWCDTDSFELALEWANNGNDDLRNKYLKTVSELELSIGNTDYSTLKSTYGVGGAYPDIGRYVSGELCHMVQPVMVNDKPIVKIAVPVNANAGISSETLFNYGASILCLVYQLEKSGVASVELTAVKYNKDYGDRVWGCTFPLKLAGDPVSIDNLAFHVCSSSSLRRLMFKVSDSKPNKDISLGGGLNSSSSRVTRFDNFALTQDLVLPVIERDMSLNDAWNKIKKAVAKSPITIEL